MKLGDWLSDQPFGLAMSSGFFAFFAHAGMMEAVTQRGFVPRLVAGSSAGALVGGAWASCLDASAVAEQFVGLSRADFWDPAPGAGLLAGKKFDQLLRDMLPVATMRECEVAVKISVFDIVRRRTVVLDDGELSPAIRASCAVPGLFHPVWIERRAYWDGGILDRPGLAGVPDGERVLYHHIASKSPWRTREPALLRRPNMVTLVIDDLPRSGPFKLEAGHRALELARDATAYALDAPIIDGVVRVRSGARAGAR